MKVSTILPVLSAIALAPIAVGLLEAPASAITFVLSGVDFPPPGTAGGTATGSFEYNPTSNLLSSWNLNTTAGAVSAFNYTTATSSGDAPSSVGFVSGLQDQVFFFESNTTTQALAIFVRPLIGAGVNNTIGATYDVFVGEGAISDLDSVFGNLIAGTTSAGFRVSTGTLTAVPEPITMAGLALGSGFGVLLRRKYKKSASVSN
ncbi:PEP-CTERM sorting domain-containing protein [Nostoc parmelioides]|uniref:PEP-CTERM sorting domain-containing protein n=1 Tax=Nostoc parmelioides FACHB-3921 TaxID=2692909 RepID=A0ABR8BKM8_9NOSO|nr:PEP-CTERM sorting domain-containing protein [Nostoc parmelioides]MBD2254496.1 PEP-CTERM sorting domain-containing protein [Nostoc parmelioides FACHB-3921]